MPDLLGRLQRALADRYAVASEIGRGGMATVFLAEDLRHRRKVAIKVLHPELAAAVGPERFLREIETVASLNHPHVLPLHDSGEADGLLFFVMPFVEGASLRQRLDAETQLPVDEAVRIAIEVCDGLDYAHRSGVVHRDVKPGNVLLSEGHAVITDFGIARALSGGRDRDATQAGLGVGTPSYASPEQASGTETLDGRADIYSLGCVLYEMLA
ncbi:MAG: serine/threonine-protein kinase, partial [Gemmatimonadota bacterium]